MFKFIFENLEFQHLKPVFRLQFNHWEFLKEVLNEVLERFLIFIEIHTKIYVENTHHTTKITN